MNNATATNNHNANEKVNRVLLQCAMILPIEMMERISGRKDTINIDLHGLYRAEAQRLIKNVISLCRESMRIRLIHGYHHGTVLKEMIGGMEHEKFAAKVVPENNPGITLLMLRDLYARPAV